MAARRGSGILTKVGAVSLYQRGHQFWLYWREKGITRRMPAGRERKEALRRAAELNAQAASGLTAVFGFERIAIPKLVRRWLEHHDLVVRSSVSTVRRYASASQHLLKFCAEHCRARTADEFGPRDAEDFVKFLRTSRVSPNGHQNTARRLLRDKGLIFILEVCRGLFNYAIRQRNLPPYAQNPFCVIGIERMTVENAKPVLLFSGEEEAYFLKACDPWQMPLFFTMALTGMRPGELVHLMVEDVSLPNRLLHIRNRPQLGWRTKTRQERMVYAFEELAEVLVRAIAGRSSGVLFLARRFASGEAAPPLGELNVGDLEAELARRIAVLRGASGAANRIDELRLVRRFWKYMGAVCERDIRREFMAVARRMGRPEMTCPKVWRHQMATVMQMTDVDPFVRKEMLGHSTLQTTAWYTHTGPAALGAQMGKILAVRGSLLEVARERLGCQQGPAVRPCPQRQEASTCSVLRPSGLGRRSEACVGHR